MQFSHLHVHTEYSLLDGMSRIDSLYARAVADKMPALAISDHGNMFGVFRFVAEAYKHLGADGKPLVKPIVGCEFYLCQNRHQRKFTLQTPDKRYHQILLAKNMVGYQNLSRLCSLGYLEGMYGKYPRIDKEIIEQYHEGLIATTCCISATIPQMILRGELDKAEQELQWWLQLFGEDFYIELQRHHLPEQDKVNAHLVQFARKYAIKMIATNDSHYTDPEDADTHDILLCINTGSTVDMPKIDDETAADPNLYPAGMGKNKRRFAFPNHEFYLKTTAQMTTLFADLPEAIDNTNDIVDKVELLHLTRDILLPHFTIPPTYATQDDYLRFLTDKGAAARYSEMTDQLRERIDFELSIIRKMGFAGYFLIVADMIAQAKKMGVSIGQGRGSAAGSVVAYCLRITNIEPIKYNLLFERFLNPDRKSMPDIDTDFDTSGREKVIKYICDKYGKDQVAQIITYSTMGAKMAIKDVARAKNLPLTHSEMLANLVPKDGQLRKILQQPVKSFRADFNSEQINDINTLRAVYEQKQDCKFPGDRKLQSEVLQQAIALEGAVRQVSVHAAGIIIAPQPLSGFVPVCTVNNTPMPVCQINGRDIESAGVIKIDILGLETLNIIQTTLALIKKRHGIWIDMDNIALDDKKTFALYQKADTIGTFQFESAGMRRYLKELRPDTIEDLIAMNALYRPGPMEYIPSFIRRKHGKEPIVYDLPELEEFLSDTYGIMVYQEQVMLIAQKIANFSRADADDLRKAMGKKQRNVLDKMRSMFLENGRKNNHPASVLEKIWTDWEAFASYAFNKSHSTCYAYLAYQTAYLKANYRTEYMAALMDHAKSSEKLSVIMNDARMHNIHILPPDINESSVGSTVNGEGQIRFGFANIKGFSGLIGERIIHIRQQQGKFTDVFDLVEKIEHNTLNKRSLEALVYSGAFDCFGLPRMLYVQTNRKGGNNADIILKYARDVHKVEGLMATSLFADQTEQNIKMQRPKLGEYTPVPLIETLSKEREHINFYLSSHPLDDYGFERLLFAPHHCVADFLQYKEELEGGGKVTPKVFRLQVFVTQFQPKIAQNANAYGKLEVEDKTGKLELSVYGKTFSQFINTVPDKNCQHQVLTLYVSMEKRPYGNEYMVQVKHISLLNSSAENAVRKIRLRLPVSHVDTAFCYFLRQNMQAYPGKIDVQLTLYADDNAKSCLVLQKKQAIRLQGNPSLKQFLVSQTTQQRMECAFAFA